MSCHSLLSAGSPRFICNWHGVLPPGWGSLEDGKGSSPLFGVGGWVPDGSPSLAAIKVCTGVAEGGDILHLIGSLQNAIALMTAHAATSISSTEWNKMTDSTAEYQSTPLGCICPNWMQIPVMYSSCMEVALNGVPSPLVSTRTHIWLRISTSSPGMQSQAAKLVAVDVVDFAGGKDELCKDWLRKICWLLHKMWWNHQIFKH